MPFAAIQLAWWHWAVFGAVVTLMLVLDLAVFHRRAREPSLRQSAFWTIFWVPWPWPSTRLIWWWGGSESAIYFLTGYLVEWSLSMDNVFVFAVIFSYFQVPQEASVPRAVLGHLGRHRHAAGLRPGRRRADPPLRMDLVAAWARC